jgi:hypothetical protein
MPAFLLLGSTEGTEQLLVLLLGSTEGTEQLLVLSVYSTYSVQVP